MPVLRMDRTARRQMQTNSLQFARTVRKMSDVYEIVQKTTGERGDADAIAVDADPGRDGAAACRPVIRS
jgi:hypothetical protein